MPSCHQGHFMEFWERASSLLNGGHCLPWFRCQLTNMKVNDCWQAKTYNKWQQLSSQCELICLHVHLLGSWSPIIKPLHIKGYRLLFIPLYSKEYISLWTDLKASDGLELNFQKNSKVIDLGLQDNFILSVEKFYYVYSNGQVVLPLCWLWPLCQFLQKNFKIKNSSRQQTRVRIFPNGFEAQKRQT